MAGLSVLWYVGAGFLMGWVISTLTEWLWFRRRHLGTDAAGRSAGGQSVGGQSAGGQSVDSAVQRRRLPLPHPAADYQPYVGASAQPSAASGNRPDALSDIRGIGDVYEQRLYEAGIFTWHELSLVDEETLRAVTKALPTSNLVSWIEQARQLAAESGRIGAAYTGPLPSDLTRIQGIDQVFEQELVQAGILTFAQLAQTTAPKLAAILPAHRLDDAINFAAWIAEARELQAKG